MIFLTKIIYGQSDIINLLNDTLDCEGNWGFPLTVRKSAS